MANQEAQQASAVISGASEDASALPPTPSISPPGSVTGEPVDALRLDAISEDVKTRERRLRGGLHVLNTEAVALSNLTRLYESDPVAQDGFSRAVQAIARQHALRGTLAMVGVGKSGLIGQKLAATFRSLGIRAVSLHPTEALHGDLGMLGPDDTVLFITHSGSTEELLKMLPHVDAALPAMVLTSHTRRETCALLALRPTTVLLPAPTPESESASFGVAAPTTSTTMALALGDALAVAAANEVHGSVAGVFARNHPGGAIGADAQGRLRDVG